MMSIAELQRWVSTCDPCNHVAVDDGGLCIVELAPDGSETGAYIEIGGTPAGEDEDSRVASAEGWCLIGNTGTGREEIQRDDEAGIFDSDEDAIAHVRARAAEGSEIHKRAIEIHDGDAALPEEAASP